MTMKYIVTKIIARKGDRIVYNLNGLYDEITDLESYKKKIKERLQVDRVSLTYDEIDEESK